MKKNLLNPLEQVRTGDCPVNRSPVVNKKWAKVKRKMSPQDRDTYSEEGGEKEKERSRWVGTLSQLLHSYEVLESCQC